MVTMSRKTKKHAGLKVVAGSGGRTFVIRRKPTKEELIEGMKVFLRVFVREKMISKATAQQWRLNFLRDLRKNGV
jgi:hypothetical protein